MLDKSPVSGPGRGPSSCNSLLFACEQLGQIVSKQENRTKLSDQGYRTQTTLGWVPGWPGILSLPGIKAAKGIHDTNPKSVLSLDNLGWDGSLEKRMATHSSILAWRIPWAEEPGGLQSKGSQSRTRLSDFHFLFSVRIHGEVESFLRIFVNASDRSSYVALCSSGVAPMTLTGTSYT